VRVPGPAVPRLGLAGVIVVAGLLTIADFTTELAAPACAVLAVAGLALLPRRTGMGVRALPAAKVDRLCDGRTYDWVEALG